MSWYFSNEMAQAYWLNARMAEQQFLIVSRQS
jgi:hypothetical protein